MLNLTEVSLLWTFLPSLPGTEKPQLITNEVLSNVKVRGALMSTLLFSM